MFRIHYLKKRRPFNRVLFDYDQSFDDLNKCSSNIGYAYSIIDMLDG
jgi:hypothetical protein